jgi:hypothetical protein
VRLPLCSLISERRLARCVSRFSIQDCFALVVETGAAATQAKRSVMARRTNVVVFMSLVNGEETATYQRQYEPSRGVRSVLFTWRASLAMAPGACLVRKAQRHLGLNSDDPVLCAYSKTEVMRVRLKFWESRLMVDRGRAASTSDHAYCEALCDKF